MRDIPVRAGSTGPNGRSSPSIGLGVVAFVSGLHVAHAQITFTAATNYPVGNQPVWVTAADVNGDGRMDLITANLGGFDLTVLTNSGDDTFGSNATYEAGEIQAVVAADINHDGKVDLIAAGGDTLEVFTNNGAGGFIIASIYNVDLSPYWVIAADVNGDGWVDLVSGNGTSLVILTNDGAGNFVLASEPGVSSRSVAVADVNGDGKMDLLEVAPYSSGSSTLLVLTNAGNGTFSLCSSNSLATRWACLISALDVNSDGKMDVIVPDFDSSQGKTLTVLTNDGTGHFTISSVCPAGNGPYSVIPADLDGDGRMELVCGSKFGSALTILTNNGLGGFGSNSTLNAQSAVVAAADLNGDGKLDLATVGTSLSVLYNTSIFPPPTTTPALTMNTSGGNLSVSWPAESAGWSLQQVRDLNSMNWSPSGYDGYPIVDDGTNNNLILPATGGHLFFRLLHP